jgi:hypothetical protein
MEKSPQPGGQTQTTPLEVWRKETQQLQTIPSPAFGIAPASSHLIQMATLMNGSQRVQAQHRLADELHGIPETWHEPSQQTEGPPAQLVSETSAEPAGHSPSESISSSSAVIQKVDVDLIALAAALGAAAMALLYQNWPAGRSVSNLWALIRHAGPRNGLTFAYFAAWDSPSVINLARLYAESNNGLTASEWVTIAGHFPANSVAPAVYCARIPGWSAASIGQLAQTFLATPHNRTVQEWAAIAAVLAPNSSTNVADFAAIAGWSTAAVRQLATNFLAGANGRSALDWTTIAATLPSNAHANATAFARIHGWGLPMILQLAQSFLHQPYKMEAQDWATAATVLGPNVRRVETTLQAMIRNYGKKNKDFVRLLIQNSAGELTPKASVLVRFLDSLIVQLPPSMRIPGNFKNLKLALISATSAKEATAENLNQLDLARVNAQWKLLKKNLFRVEARISSDWPAIQEKFGIRGPLGLIHLTGSDFHNEGQSVSIAESVRGEKVVYKPRSLAPDMALTGHQKSAFSALNEFGAREGAGLSLPTTRFQQESDKHGKYGYMEFLEHQEILTQSQAEIYYIRLGQLVVAAKLLGATDLHQENVLTGSGAPFVIDAETSFLPYVMLRQSFDSTGLRAALLSFQNLGKATTNAFLTVEEDKAFKKIQQQNPAASRKTYLAEKRSEVLEGRSSLSPYFAEGIQRMLAFIERFHEPLTKFLLTMATRIKHVRIVPIDTLTFKGYQRSYVNGPGQRVNVHQAVLTDLTQELGAAGFDVLNGALAGALDSYLDQEFMRADIPIFHYEPQHETVYYRGVQIATTKHGQTLPDAIRLTVQRLTKISVQEVVASYLAAN